MEEKRDFTSGVTSTKQIRLSLIPHRGLVNAAKRFELGLERHGEKAWNNLSENQSALQDRDWLIERCSHGIEHLYRLIDFYAGKGGISLEDAKGDAGAAAWCGLVLGEALCTQTEIPLPPPKPSEIREVASNLDHQKCRICKQEFKSQDAIMYFGDGAMHSYCYHPDNNAI